MSTKPRQSQNPNPGPKPGGQPGPIVNGPREDRTADILRNPGPPATPKTHKFKTRSKGSR
ncbi:MAG: hypothetical protein ACKVU4_12160 [Phycisphaerales bacterium]